MRPTPEKGDPIGEYVLERPIGEGGFGQVWLARHSVLPDREVAVKLLKDPELTDVLRRESLLQWKLEHPGIVKVLGVNLDSPNPYLILEYIQGGNLAERIKACGRLPVRRTVEIFVQILGILQYAHERGVVHRDLKPSNILLDASGQVRVSDFGLGKSLDVVSASRLKLSFPSGDLSGGNRFGGTLEYMAPEQAEGRPVDTRCDMYSLGIILYETLTGERPSGRVSLEALSPALDHIFARCYTSLEHRYHSADEALEDLQGYAKQLNDGGQNVLSSSAPTGSRGPPDRASGDSPTGKKEIVKRSATAAVLGALLGLFFLFLLMPFERRTELAQQGDHERSVVRNWEDPAVSAPGLDAQPLLTEKGLRRRRVLERAARRETYEVELLSVTLDEDSYRRELHAALEPGDPDVFVKVFKREASKGEESLIYDGSEHVEEGWSVEWTFREGGFPIHWKMGDVLRVEIWEDDIFGDNLLFELKDASDFSIALLSRTSTHQDTGHRVRFRSDFEFP